MDGAPEHHGCCIKGIVPRVEDNCQNMGRSILDGAGEEYLGRSTLSGASGEELKYLG